MIIGTDRVKKKNHYKESRRGGISFKEIKREKAKWIQR
jgi:hypothetical protein